MIVNADDFGMSPAVNAGIVEAVRAGTVTALSLLVNAPGWEDARTRAAACSTPLDTGLHFNLTLGSPVAACPVPSLADAGTGRFLPLRKLAARALAGRVLAREVQLECEAQIQRAADAGFRLTHLDSHQHVHALPVIAPAVMRASRAAGIPVTRRPTQALRCSSVRAWARVAAINVAWRVATRGRPTPGAGAPHVLGLDLRGAHDVLPRLLRALDRLPTGTTELVVHPGHVDPELCSADPYTTGRERELEALLSPRFAARLARDDIQLVGFAAR